MLSGVIVALIVAAGSANAVRVSDCVDGGGIVVRCSEQPVTREDKIVCPTPGKANASGASVGSTTGLEILETGGDSRYGVPQ
ncbi:hypothetical protein ACIBEK_23810 [Nocardia fusca]|uniref:hypothetical protein n=1 Tax=Nocardia fusca TaxID=941183 RepID=UPI003788AB92